MTSQLDVARAREIVARWCNLAEQRLDYLTELFETGRWRRFYSEHAFLENIRQAKAAVEAWRDLLSREASRDNRAIDMSWLGRTRTALPLSPFRHDPRHLPQVAEAPLHTPRENSILPEDDGIEVCETSSADGLPDDAMALVPDLATAAERFRCCAIRCRAGPASALTAASAPHSFPRSLAQNAARPRRKDPA